MQLSAPVTFCAEIALVLRNLLADDLVAALGTATSPRSLPGTRFLAVRLGYKGAEPSLRTPIETLTISASIRPSTTAQHASGAVRGPSRRHPGSRAHTPQPDNASSDVTIDGSRRTALDLASVRNRDKQEQTGRILPQPAHSYPSLVPLR